jgi:hypothetical protein
MKRLISWILGHSNARMVLAARERRRAPPVGRRGSPTNGLSLNKERKIW